MYINETFSPSIKGKINARLSKWVNEKLKEGYRLVNVCESTDKTFNRRVTAHMVKDV